MNEPSRTKTQNKRGCHWVRRGWLVALFSLPLVHGGCTAALWEQKGPHARVWIPASQVTEVELRQQGRKFDKIRMTKQGLRERGIPCEEKVVDGYLAEKSRQQKLGDTVVLVVGTPVTVVIDGVLVCGAVAGWVGLETLRNWPQWACTVH
jgi:hypothetical protein